MYNFIYNLIYPTVEQCIADFDKAIRNLEHRAALHTRTASALFASANAHQSTAERATKIAANLSKLVK